MSIGWLHLSAALFALLFGIIAALASTGFMARRGYADAGNALYLALGIGLLGARLAYVAAWWPQYRMHLASVVNIRDGGFDPLAGLIALVAAALVIGWRRPPVRRALAVGVVVGVAAWTFGGLAARKLTESAHPPLPTIALNDLDGKPVAIASLRGQPTVINLWATWCGPCRREMPVLAEAQRTLPHIRFVFADQGESAAIVRHYMQVQNLTLRNVLIDTNLQLSTHYNVRGYPTTLFLDANGQLRDIHVGELSRATLAEGLERIVPAVARP